MADAAKQEMTYTNEQAQASAQRFIDEHFKNPGPKPDTRIPARPEDDDLVLMGYLRQVAALEASVPAPNAVTVAPVCPYCGSTEVEKLDNGADGCSTCFKMW